MFSARLRFSKTGSARYLSHLDTMHVFQRSFQRANLNLRFTEGFNPHPYVSVLLPLPTGFSGLDEIIDFDLTTDLLPDDTLLRINRALPSGILALEIYKALKKPGEIAFASYEIALYSDLSAVHTAGLSAVHTAGLSAVHTAGLSAVHTAVCSAVLIDELFERSEIRTVKRSKSGETEINIKDFMVGLKAFGKDGFIVADTVISAGNINLNPEYVTKVIERDLCGGASIDALYTRKAILTKELEVFR